MIEVVVTAKGRRWAQTGHPWIYRDDLAAVPTTVAPGDLVRVVAEPDRFLGFAFYSSHSRIALRLVTRTAEEPTEDFWEASLLQALAYRRRVVWDTTAYRLLYAEADGFPGLILDYYHGHLVAQIHHPGPERLLPLLVELWRRHLQPESIILRNDSDVRRLEGLPQEVKVVWGQPPPLATVQEGSVQLRVDLQRGQKTGLFLDQRENRLAAAALAQGQVLDCFSYQGGFALQVARRAARVTAVEASAAALALARQNADLNGLAGIEWVQANCFDFLKDAVASGQRYDLIILDPPAFAKSRQERQGAIRGYRELNRRALQLAAPGGILITSSCSYNLTSEDFLNLLRQAAREVGRPVRLLEQRGAARDHPVHLFLPESSYLKCFFLQVE